MFFLPVSLPRTINECFIRIVANLVESKWQKFAVFLGRKASSLHQYKEKSNESFLLAMMAIEDWVAECGRKATVIALIRACEECGIHRDNIEAAYKEKACKIE